MIIAFKKVVSFINKWWFLKVGVIPFSHILQYSQPLKWIHCYWRLSWHFFQQLKDVTMNLKWSSHEMLSEHMVHIHHRLLGLPCTTTFTRTRWWFQYFSFSSLSQIWGRFPFWLRFDFDRFRKPRLWFEVVWKVDIFAYLHFLHLFPLVF